MTELTHKWVDEWNESPSSGNGGGGGEGAARLQCSRSRTSCSARRLRQELSWQKLPENPHFFFLVLSLFENQQVLSITSPVPRSQGVTLFFRLLELCHQISAWRGACTAAPSLHLTVLCDCDWYHRGVMRVDNQTLPLVSDIPGLGDSCCYDAPPWKCGWCGCQHLACICIYLSRQTWERPVFFPHFWRTHQWRQFHLLLWEQWQQKLPKCWFVYSCYQKLCVVNICRILLIQ